jgi:predicted  nucleic acid-binding Zn-ribbon protein
MSVARDLTAKLKAADTARVNLEEELVYRNNKIQQLTSMVADWREKAARAEGELVALRQMALVKTAMERLGELQVAKEQLEGRVALLEAELRAAWSKPPVEARVYYPREKNGS